VIPLLRRTPLALPALAALLLATVLPIASASADTPSDALRDFFGAVNVVLLDPATEDQPMERLRAIRRHVDDVFDFREASMLALGREWSARTPREQNEFVALFADLLERAFVWRVAGKATTVGGVKVAYVSEDVERETATVETAVAARDGNPLRLGFRMVRRAGRWVVRDVVMDGVSTMENYHAQFQRLARDGSWADLMAQLRAKVGTPTGTVQVAAAPVSTDIAPPLEAAVVLARAPYSSPPPTGPLPRSVVAMPNAALNGTPAIEPARAKDISAAPEAITSAPAATAPRDSMPPAPGAAPAMPRVEAPPVTRTVIARPVSTAATGWWVQVGAYRNASAAGKVAAHVHGEIVVLTTPAGTEPPLMRVRVGPFADRARAEARRNELEAQGWRAFIVR